MYVGVIKRNEKVEYVSVFLGCFVVRYDRVTNSVVQNPTSKNSQPQGLGSKSIIAAAQRQQMLRNCNPLLIPPLCKLRGDSQERSANEFSKKSFTSTSFVFS